MIFWIFLCIFVILLYLLEDNLPYPIKKLFSILILFIVLVVSGFRYRIGWDYDHYMYLFEKLDTIDISSEISLTIIINLLKSLSLDFQALFLFYSLFTLLFLWQGIKYYSQFPVMSLLFYVLIPELYWTSFSEIRQFLAISIFFYGSRFIIERNLLKFTLVLLVAAFVHTSAIFLWPLYFFVTKYYKKVFHISLIILSITISANKLQLPYLQTIFEIFDLKYIYYVTNIEYTKSLSSNIIQWIFIPFWLIILIKRINAESRKCDLLVVNMLTLGLALDYLTDFSQPLNRIIYYFVIYRIILLSWIAEFFIIGSRKIINYAIIVFLAIIFLTYVYRVPFSEAGIAHSYFSANNIQYEFNFDLFR
ncbi:EpsG family protein [Sporolituus thermophilus]|uniref:EpsG family protein n=1 Tax=Sporolituus thermophilus DSM 23256 TaxID=1123285 RepID=A0A1G7NCV7_9FIRM|nr:EpsG family protein [Sporolituus thermophilus]SDF71854.1 EpsG family protein [Sporolituus thermophilus DSM 23256]